MNARKLAIVSVAFAGLLAAAASAEARGRDDVQFSLSIGSSPFFSVQPVHGPSHRSFDRRHDHGYRHAPIFRDRDRDGIPNRFDRVYNPRWDRDGDGIPNRFDRRNDNRHDHDRRGRSR